MIVDWEFLRYFSAKILQVLGLILTSAGILGKTRLKRIERYNRFFRRSIKFSLFFQQTSPFVSIFFFIFFIVSYLVVMSYFAHKIWIEKNLFEQIIAIIIILSFSCGVIYMIFVSIHKTLSSGEESFKAVSYFAFFTAFIGSFFFTYSRNLSNLLYLSSFWIMIPYVGWLSYQAIQKSSLKEFVALSGNPLNWNSYIGNADFKKSVLEKILDIFAWVGRQLERLTLLEITLAVWIMVKSLNLFLAFILYFLLLPYKFFEILRLRFKLRESILAIGVLLSLIGIILD